MPGRSKLAVVHHLHGALRTSASLPPIRRASPPWTEDESEKLSNLIREGNTTRSLAMVMSKRTEGAVKSHRNRLLITNRAPRVWSYWTKDEDDELVRLRQEGKSMADVAGMLPKRTYKAVTGRYFRISERLSPDLRVELWTPEEDKELAKLWREGKSMTAIADHFP